MISKNPAPKFTPIKPDFKCKYSVYSTYKNTDVCGKSYDFKVLCGGTKSDRDTCPEWK